jgi:hypothetical protein
VVERISPATGSEFSVLPADNATGNYVKIAQRIPVRIRIDPGQAKARRLAPGMSVIVSIDTSVERSNEPPPASRQRQCGRGAGAGRLRGFGAAASVVVADAGRVAQLRWKGRAAGRWRSEWWQGFGDPALTALVAGRCKTTATCASLARVWRSTGPGRRCRGGPESQCHRRHAPTRTRQLAYNGVPYVTNVYQAEFRPAMKSMWGPPAALTDAATATYQAEQANADAAALSIAATVASGYLNLRGLDAQLALTEATLKLREQSRDLAKKQFDVGYSSRLEWLQAQAEYQTTAEQVPQLKRSIFEQENACPSSPAATPVPSRVVWSWRPCSRRPCLRACHPNCAVALTLPAQNGIWSPSTPICRRRATSCCRRSN